MRGFRFGGFPQMVFVPRRRRFHATQQLYDGGFFLMWAALFHALCGKCAKLRQSQRWERKPLCKKGKTPERVAALNVAAHKRKHRKPFSLFRQFRTDGCLQEPTPEGYGEPLFPIFNGRTENGRFRGVGLNSQPGVTLSKAYRVPGSQPMGFQRARRPFGRAAAASKSAAVFRFLFGGKKEHPSPLYRKRIPFPVTPERKTGVRKIKQQVTVNSE